MSFFCQQNNWLLMVGHVLYEKKLREKLYQHPEGLYKSSQEHEPKPRYQFEGKCDLVF